VIQVLFNVEKGIEEDVRHLAVLQIAQIHLVAVGRHHHVQHLCQAGTDVMAETTK